MTLPRGLWDRHIALLASVSDVPRPVTVAEVVDLSRYTTTGAGFVGVMHGGALLWAAYRDGPAPQLGDLLQIKRGDAPLDAPWYAWPLPYAQAGCPGQLYVSAIDYNAGADWHIIRCDLAVGNVWQYRSPSPVGGVWPRRPLASYHGTRLWTWGSVGTTPGPLYRSDDAGLTWTAAGIDVLNISRRTKQGTCYAVGGTNAYYSFDGGTTWDTLLDAPGGTFVDVDMPIGFGSAYVVFLTSTGMHIGQHFGDTYVPISTSPHSPGGGGTGMAVTPGTTVTWRAGTTIYSSGFDSLTGVGVPIATIRNGAGSQKQFGGGTAVLPLSGGSQGGIIYNVGAGVSTLYDPWDAATLTPEDARYRGSVDYQIVTGVGAAGWPLYPSNFDRACEVIAVDNQSAGGVRFIARPWEETAAPWVDIGQRQVADLGAEYAASQGGMTTLELWEVSP